jgi:tripartite-type tricarboxylate transporter receptor subunit TctC
LELPYDLGHDFQPVAMLRTTSFIVVAKSGMPGRNLKELIERLKANPRKAIAGTGGVGGAEHLAGLMFQSVTGTLLEFAPYRGSAPAIQDMLSGQIDLMFASPIVALPHIKSGGLKAYAVMGPTRLEAAPEMPTVDEAGAPGAHYMGWNALWAPKNTPSQIIAKLNGAIIAASADQSLRSRYAELAVSVPAPEQQSPEALGAFQKAELAKWAPIVRDLRRRQTFVHGLPLRSTTRMASNRLTGNPSRLAAGRPLPVPLLMTCPPAPCVVWIGNLGRLP